MIGDSRESPFEGSISRSGGEIAVVVVAKLVLMLLITRMSGYSGPACLSGTRAVCLVLLLRSLAQVP